MIKTFIIRLILSFFIITFLFFGSILGIFYYFGTGLPSHSQLANYEPQILTRVYAHDGKLLSEHASERRLFMPINSIPKRISQTFLAVEDKNFYTHYGVDILALARAFGRNIVNIAKKQRPQGASTITQQVARNFLLSNELSYGRKIKEAILSIRIEQTLSKEKILELYLNEIYLGSRNYGVAAAALNYFNKSLDDLSIAQAAYLAALPKAPNNYDPFRNPKGAKARRDWVISRMLDENIITQEDAIKAKEEPIVFAKKDEEHIIQADYFGEEVRRNVIQTFGENALYTEGLVVQTSLNSTYQKIADKALTNGLVAYDRRHGWRGPFAKIKDMKNWNSELKSLSDPKGSKNGIKTYHSAVVLGTDNTKAIVGFKDGSNGVIPFDKMKWAKFGLTSPKSLLEVGDVILAEHDKDKNYSLAQIPQVSGAIIVMDPHTGRVLALNGGYSFDISQFNRATQAQRQTGSAFKPFVYLTAFEQGIPPTLVLDDAPITIDLGQNQEPWSPKNYGKTYYGPITLRHALENSRNIVTVKLAQKLGMKAVCDTTARFGIQDNMPQQLAMVLGAGETTPLKLTCAYAKIANGGKEVTPSLIDWIQDRRGKIISRHDKREYDTNVIEFDENEIPELPDTRKQISDPQSIAQLNSILEGTVLRGTGRLLSSLKIPIAAKTGSSQDSRDTWFIAYTPNLVVGVFIGFDSPKDMGRTETGATLPAPVCLEFMKEALKNTPAIPFRTPKGVHLKRINFKTGEPASAGDPTAIWEVFKDDQKQTSQGPLPVSSILQGTGEIY